jgi:hypothetical protein
MNEMQFGYRVKQTLNKGLALDAATLERLRSARFKALDLQPVSAAAGELAVAGMSSRFQDKRALVARIVLPLLMLVLGLLASNQWYQSQLQAEIIEIDTEVLTGELPLDAYLDRGFDAWLKRSSE